MIAKVTAVALLIPLVPLVFGASGEVVGLLGVLAAIGWFWLVVAIVCIRFVRAVWHEDR